MFTDDTISRFSTTTSISPDDMDSTEPEVTRPDPLDDVFGGDPDDAHLSEQRPRDDGLGHQTRSEDVSDVPRLQGIHTTNGYRDGIASSKEKFLQEGFDEGYSLGAELGAAAGRVIGVLESLATAIRADDDASDAREAIAKLLEQGKSELSAKELYGQEYFGEDGIWKYEVAGDGDARGEDNVTFRLVASNHPSIKKWTSTVDGLLEQYQLRGRDS